MGKNYIDLIINEIKNFEELKEQYGYRDIDDLIGHYIEEGVISSSKELINTLRTLKKQLGISIREKTFDDWWINKIYCTCKI